MHNLQLYQHSEPLHSAEARSFFITAILLVLLYSISFDQNFLITLIIEINFKLINSYFIYKIIILTSRFTLIFNNLINNNNIQILTLYYCQNIQYLKKLKHIS
jgi:hypothetical protein